VDLYKEMWKIANRKANNILRIEMNKRALNRVDFSMNPKRVDEQCSKASH